jgi:hypothetical protein
MALVAMQHLQKRHHVASHAQCSLTHAMEDTLIKHSQPKIVDNRSYVAKEVVVMQPLLNAIIPMQSSCNPPYAVTMQSPIQSSCSNHAVTMQSPMQLLLNAINPHAVFRQSSMQSSYNPPCSL